MTSSRPGASDRHRAAYQPPRAATGWSNRAGGRGAGGHGRPVQPLAGRLGGVGQGPPEPVDLPGGGRRGRADQVPGGPVRPHHPPVCVDQQHRVGQGVEQLDVDRVRGWVGREGHRGRLRRTRAGHTPRRRKRKILPPVAPVAGVGLTPSDDERSGSDGGQPLRTVVERFLPPVERRAIGRCGPRPPSTCRRGTAARSRQFRGSREHGPGPERAKVDRNSARPDHVGMAAADCAVDPRPPVTAAAFVRPAGSPYKPSRTASSSARGCSAAAAGRGVRLVNVRVGPRCPPRPASEIVLPRPMASGHCRRYRVAVVPQGRS